MNTTPRTAKNRAKELTQDVDQLLTAIEALPAENLRRIQPALDRVIEATKRRRRILTLVQQALGQLRLDMKYLVFDLEATRRERDEYRRQVEDA